MENLLSKSIEFRATELILNGVDPIEAVKQALIDETNMIGTLINSNSKLSARGRIAADYHFNKLFNSVKA